MAFHDDPALPEPGDFFGVEQFHLGALHIADHAYPWALGRELLQITYCTVASNLHQMLDMVHLGELRTKQLTLTEGLESNLRGLGPKGHPDKIVSLRSTDMNDLRRPPRNQTFNGPVDLSFVDSQQFRKVRACDRSIHMEHPFERSAQDSPRCKGG